MLWVKPIKQECKVFVGSGSCEEAPEQVKHSLDLQPNVLALPHLLLILED